MTEAKVLKTHGMTIDLLMTEWQLTRKQVQTIRRIIYDDEFDLKQFESVRKRHQECFNPPDRIDCQLTAINEIMDAFGVESIQVSESLFQDRYYWNSIAQYVNVGETYQLTVLYNTVDGVFEFNSWGEYYEQMESRLEKELNKYLEY